MGVVYFILAFLGGLLAIIGALCGWIVVEVERDVRKRRFARRLERELLVLVIGLLLFTSGSLFTAWSVVSAFE